MYRSAEELYVQAIEFLDSVNVVESTFMLKVCNLYIFFYLYLKLLIFRFLENYVQYIKRMESMLRVLPIL